MNAFIFGPSFSTSVPLVKVVPSLPNFYFLISSFKPLTATSIISYIDTMSQAKIILNVPISIFQRFPGMTREASLTLKIVLRKVPLLKKERPYK